MADMSGRCGLCCQIVYNVFFFQWTFVFFLVQIDRKLFAIYQSKCQTFPGSSFSNVRIFSFSMFHIKPPIERLDPGKL